MYIDTQLIKKGLLLSTDQSQCKKTFQPHSKNKIKEIISLFINSLFYSLNKLQLSHKQGDIVSGIKFCSAINSRRCNNAKRK